MTEPLNDTSRAEQEAMKFKSFEEDKQLSNEWILPENPTELDLKDYEEWKKQSVRLAEEEERRKNYVRQMTDADKPMNLDEISKEGIGSTVEEKKREEISEYLEDLMLGDARIDVPVPNSAGDEVDWEWVKYCLEDNQEAHMALNQCLELVHKRVEGMEKYLGEMERPERVMQDFLLSVDGKGAWMNLQEQFDSIHNKIENMELRLDGVIKSRLATIEQNDSAIKFLIGTFNERLDKLEGKDNGVQPAE